MSVAQPIASTSAIGSSTTPDPNAPTTTIARSKNGRSTGKALKSAKAPLRRSYISPAVKTPFEKRKEEDKKKQAIKDVEKEMKQELADEKERKANAIRERRARVAEKARLQEMAARMSAKKLQRLRKRQGRSKKING